ncbi:MAG: hypothetical protein DI560_25910 [Pseudomonas putida]|nr:MAG: hypothetical protein DI560_25910 [Pseudomonas putida]
MSGKFGDGVRRYWWALVAGYRATQRSFAAWGSKDDRFFEPLTPVLVEKERVARYERELLRALHNDEVLNIAVTGGYGAGKSSVLKTFFEHHPGFKHTFVSLATFTKANTPAATGSMAPDAADGASSTASTVTATNEGAASADLLNRIEETIVQQLLYAVKADQLPKTRLKRITHASTARVWWRTICVAAIGICTLRLGAPKLQTLSEVAKEWALKGVMWIPEPAALLVVTAGCVWLLYSALKLFSLFSIDGLTLKGGKLEATHHGSVLHKNVDEIIYCFERSDIEVVVIEDLDRFDIQEIFFRLREINFIISQSPQVTRSIHFIYALRDEMFAATDKTKFFDLIIPIIPVVHSENSREKLVELLGQRKVGDQLLSAGLSPKLIETVGYHIDEMRLIKNIVNEFDLYANLLAADGLVLDPNKLFGMVALRNLHPEAYSDLLKRKGTIYQVIEGYSAWVITETDRLQAEIADLRQSRAKREAEVATDLASLRACVWFEIFRKGGLQQATTLTFQDGTSVSLLAFVEEEVFNRALNQRQVTPQVNVRHYGTQTGEAVNPKAVLQGLKYDERVTALQMPLGDIDDETIELQRKIARLKTMPFRLACSAGYGESFAPKLTGYELIIFLLHRGYLDTDYTDYLGYFYEGSLSQADKMLTMALARGETLEVGTPIRNPERVASKLDLDSVDKGKGLLVYLVAELAQSRQDEVQARKEKLSVILKSGHQHMGRLSEVVVLLPVEARAAFINALFENDPNLINQLLSYEKATFAREDLVVMVLDSLAAEQVEQLHGRKGTLLRIINELRDVSKLVPGLATNEMGWAWLRSKPAQFVNANDVITAEELKQLVEWGCISPGLPMLKLLCRSREPGSEVGTVSHARLDALGLTGFGDIVAKAPTKYVDELLSQEGALEETEQSLLGLLALLKGEDDLQLALFERTHCIVDDLDNLPVALWLPALESERISAKGDNVWKFFDSVVMTADDTKLSGQEVRYDLGQTAVPTFIDFIARNASGLAQDLWGKEKEEELQSFLIENERVTNATLHALFSKIILEPSALVKSTVPIGRWVAFYNAPYVGYSLEIRELISKYDPAIEARYIAHHWKVARDTLDLTTLSIVLVVLLSRSSAVSLTDAMMMWQGITIEALSTRQGAIDDLAYTCARANDVQAIFPTSYLPVLVQCSVDASLNAQLRTALLIQMLQMNCSWQHVAAVLPLLGEDHAQLINKARAHFSTSEDDIRLAEALKRRGYVGTVKCEAKRTVVYGKRKQMIS